MGSLISRRKRTVKVEAKSISVQATECGIREPLVRTEQSTELEVDKQKTAMMELKIGDGLLPSPENTARHLTKEKQCAANENRKRKVGLPKTKVRPQAGRKHPKQGSKDSSTQYGVFGVPYHVTPPKAHGEAKSPSFQTDALKGKKAEDIEQENKKRKDKPLDTDSKITEADICDNEDIDEDILDWNVDDRVRSPSDPGKEDDSDSCSCQEVIAESPGEEESQEDLMVTGNCSDSGGAGPENNLLEDTLDTNVDDRVHSPSDTRSNGDNSSEEEDDTIDLLVTCAMGGGDLTLPSQRQSSLTTLKDGDSADASIYSPPPKSPSQKKESAETDDKVSKDAACVKQSPSQDKEESVSRGTDVSPQGMAVKSFGVEEHTRVSQECHLSASAAEEGEKSVTVGMSGTGQGSRNTSHTSLENRSRNTSHSSLENGSWNTSHISMENGSRHTTSQGSLENVSQNMSHSMVENGSQITSHNSMENGSWNTSHSSLENRTWNTSHSSLKNESQNTRQSNMENGSQNTGYHLTSFSIKDSASQHDEHDLPAVNSHEPPTEGRTPLGEAGDIQDSLGNATDSRKHDSQTGKLVMNLGDGTLSFGDEEMSKTVLEMQEAEALTLLLLSGTLPTREGTEDVNRGAGDGQNVELSGTDIPEDKQGGDERAGLASMLDTRSKSSCQLEQLVVEHSQVENAYNTVPFNAQTNHSTDNDISAACAEAEDEPQAEPPVDTTAGEERHTRAVPDDNTPSHPVDHGAAAASFEEEKTDEGLVPPQRTSSGAASSEGDWQSVQTAPQHQRLVQINNLGGLAAGASSNRSYTSTHYSHEIAAVAHQTIAGHDAEPYTLVIEVQAAATTDIVAQSPRNDPPAQQDDVAQASNIISPGLTEQNQCLPSQADDFSRRESPKGTSEDVEPNVQEWKELEGTENPGERIAEPAQLQDDSANTATDQVQQSSEHLTESSKLRVHSDFPQSNDKSGQD
ncbi:hypothetical protein ACOMHN_047419 [Nucella lapillus]